MHQTNNGFHIVSAFHVRGFIKILHMPTIYGDRRYTSQRICLQNKCRTCLPIGTLFYQTFQNNTFERRTKFPLYILRSLNDEPMRQVTYKNGSANAVSFIPTNSFTIKSLVLIISRIRLPKWKYPCSSTPAPNLHCPVTRPGAQASFLFCCGCQQRMHGERKLISSKAPFFQVVVKKGMYVQSLQKHMEFSPLVCRLSTSYI